MGGVIIDRLKKVWILMMMMLIVTVFLVTGCSADIFSLNNRNKYILNAYYNLEDRSLFCSQKLIYKNTEDTSLEEIYFHIYPNAFLEESTAPMIGGVFQNYPNGFNPGSIDIISVWIEGKTASWEVLGMDKTLLMVKLKKPLEINQNIEVKIDFNERLPESKTDFGYFQGVACFENWYPIVSVYDQDGWNKNLSRKIGEVNFSETSDYIVEINLPQDQIVASTGRCIKEKKHGNGRKKVTLKADNVRDFTWICSNRFTTFEKKAGKVLIKAYLLDDNTKIGMETLDMGQRAIEFFSNTFGEYPYDTFSIVETYLYGGAMEYPMLTSIGQEFFKSADKKVLESGIAHEIAHQWWYVVVGNNEYKNPWLDESLATYSEAMYFEKYYGKQELNVRIDPKIALMRFNNSIGDSMEKFDNPLEYSLVVYLKGAHMLNQFRQIVGDKKFIETLSKYYNTYKFKNADTTDFLKIVRLVCGSEAERFFVLKLKTAG